MIHDLKIHHFIMRGIGIGLSGASSTWIITLMVHGSQVRAIVESGSVQVHVGRLLLHTIHKAALPEGGHRIRFTFEPGLWWLFGSCMVIGGFAGWLWARRVISKEQPRHS